jgi:hypothetical protein
MTNLSHHPLVVLDSIGHISVRRGNSIFKAAVFLRIYLEGELVALVLIGKLGNDDGCHRVGDRPWCRVQRIAAARTPRPKLSAGSAAAPGDG